MNYESFCSEVLKISPNIRFAGIYDKVGKHQAGGLRKGMKSYLNDSQTNDSIQWELQRWKQYEQFHQQLGKAQVSMVKYDRATLITFAINKEDLLLISIEPIADHNKIINHILALIIQNYSPL